MLVNFSELQSEVSYFLDDLDFGYHTRVTVQRYLNQAQREVQKLLLASAQNWYNKCQQATTVANACAYYLPSDFLKMHRVELVLSGTAPNEDINVLEAVTLNQQDLVESRSGTPTAYCIQKNQIKLFPVDNTATHTLRITYSHRVSDMSADTDVPDVPEEFHEMLVLLAARDGFLRDDRATLELDTKIQAYKNALKSDASDRIQSHARRVVVTRSGAGDSW